MKKRLIPAALTVLVALLFGSCELILDSGGGGGGGDAATRTFWALDLVTEDYYEVDATLRASGDKCLVYVANDELDAVSATLAQTIADEFDDDIYATIRTNFGTESDFDGNSKVILLLLDIKDGFSGSGGYVAGYFYPLDLLSADSFSTRYSNEAEMLYMDVYPQVAGSSGFISTMAHEFQHLINFNVNYIGKGSEQDTWINEGLSLSAEYVYSDAQVAERINHYNADPYGSMALGNNFFVWDGYYEGDNGDTVLDNYATAYLFFQWLRIHAENGIGIYKDILGSPYVDYRAVTTVAADKIDPSLSTWPVMLRSWVAANFLELSSGLFGYAGLIDVEAPVLTNEAYIGADWVFSPGEAVVALNPGDWVVPGSSGSNMSYAGFSDGSGVLDTESPYAGDYALSYNSNSQTDGADETGYIAKVASQRILPRMNSSRISYTVPASYPISVLMAPSGGIAPGSHHPQTGNGSSYSRTVGFTAWSRR